MKRLLLTISAVLLCAGSAQHLRAQAAPTATRNGRLQLGAGISISRPDYTPHTNKGITGYADFDLTYHLGVEAVIHETSIITPGDIGEDSYLVGPRYVFHLHRFQPYVKVLFGFGRFNTQFDNRPHTSDTYGVYAIGGGLDYRVSPHINIRGDYEGQRWPNFPPDGLTPSVTTIGVGYAF